MISGNANLKNGYTRIYTAIFTDKDDNPINWEKVNYKWNVVSDFEIVKYTHENKIDLFVDSEGLVYSEASFLLQIIIKNVVIAEIKINIIE